MILSVPEGDDKPLKYPLMFSICDALVVNKTDYLEGSDFDLPVLRERVRKLNPDIRIFEVSCKTGQGIDAWTQWLAGEIRTVQNPSP
jgi:hydrogenase nickel incorporation protein HypB